MKEVFESHIKYFPLVEIFQIKQIKYDYASLKNNEKKIAISICNNNYGRTAAKTIRHKQIIGEGFLPTFTLKESNENKAEKRAVNLLKSLVREDLFKQYYHTSCLPAYGQLTRNLYLIYGNKSVIERLNVFGEVVSTYCIHTLNSDLPTTDLVITKWMLITFYESFFLKTANEIMRPNHNREKITFLFTLPEKLNSIKISDSSDICKFPLSTTLKWGKHIDDFFVLNRSIEKCRSDRQKRLNAIAYDYTPSERDSILSENFKQIPEPIKNTEKKYCTHKLASICLTLKNIKSTQIKIKSNKTSHPNIVKKYNIGILADYKNNKEYVLLKEWNSKKDLDDAFLHILLLSHHPSQNPNSLKKEQLYSKCILSSKHANKFDSICCKLSLSLYKPLLITDDRVNDLIFFIPDANELGVLVHDKNKYGIFIKKNQIMIYYIYKSKIIPTDLVMLEEISYSNFPDDNLNAIRYCMDIYELNLRIKNMSNASIVQFVEEHAIRT